MIESVPERAPAFLAWAWAHGRRSGAGVRERLEAFSESAPVGELCDAGQVERFLRALR